MKINNAIIENNPGWRKSEDIKNAKSSSDSKTAVQKKDDLINEVKPQNLKSYSISIEESKSIINTLKESFNEINFNIESIFSNLNNDKVFSILKENN